MQQSRPPDDSSPAPMPSHGEFSVATKVELSPMSPGRPSSADTSTDTDDSDHPPSPPSTPRTGTLAASTWPHVSLGVTWEWLAHAFDKALASAAAPPRHTASCCQSTPHHAENDTTLPDVFLRPNRVELDGPIMQMAFLGAIPGHHEPAWACLEPKLLAAVGTHLAPSDLAAARLVCSPWCRSITEATTHIPLRLPPTATGWHVKLNRLRCLCPRLHSLDVHVPLPMPAPLLERQLSMLALLPNVTHFQLHCPWLCDSGDLALQQLLWLPPLLATLTTIQSLTLAPVLLDPPALHTIAPRLPHLSALCLHNLPAWVLPTLPLATLAALPALRHLAILPPADVYALPIHPTALHPTPCAPPQTPHPSLWTNPHAYGLTDPQAAALAALPHLNSLQASCDFTQFTPAALRSLAALTALTTLHLHGIPPAATAALPPVIHLPRLRHLCLSLADYRSARADAALLSALAKPPPGLATLSLALAYSGPIYLLPPPALTPILTHLTIAPTTDPDADPTTNPPFTLPDLLTAVAHATALRSLHLYLQVPPAIDLIPCDVTPLTTLRHLTSFRLKTHGSIIAPLPSRTTTALARAWPHLARLSLRLANSGDFNPRIGLPLPSFSSLQSLDLLPGATKKPLHVHLAHIPPALTALRLRGCSLLATGPRQHPPHLPLLHHLTLHAVHLATALPPALCAAARCLRTLSILDCSGPLPLLLRHASTLPHLTAITLNLGHGRHDLTGGHLACLAASPQLHELHVHANYLLEVSELAVLTRCTALCLLHCPDAFHLAACLPHSAAAGGALAGCGGARCCDSGPEACCRVAMASGCELQECGMQLRL